MLSQRAREAVSEFNRKIIVVLAAKMLEGKKIFIQEQISQRIVEQEKEKIRLLKKIPPQRENQQLSPSIMPKSNQIVKSPFSPQKRIQTEMSMSEKIVPMTLPSVLPQLMPGEIESGKMIFFLRDPSIDYIECLGEDQEIIIKKSGKKMKTPVTLTNEEINHIINSFSEKTRIPLIEGLLHARYRNLEISSVSSENLGSRFIIRKIS